MGTRITGNTTYTQEFEGAGGITLTAQWEVSYSAWLIRAGRSMVEFDDMQLEGRPKLLGHALRIGSVERHLGLPPEDELPQWQVAFARCCRGAFEQEVLQACANDLCSRYVN